MRNSTIFCLTLLIICVMSAASQNLAQVKVINVARSSANNADKAADEDKEVGEDNGMSHTKLVDRNSQISPSASESVTGESTWLGFMDFADGDCRESLQN